jgi:antitoxin YefM
MDSISLNQFRDKFQDYIDRVLDHHQPLKVTGQSGADFIVISAKDWEQTQETLYILQNPDLMQQIAKSFATHATNQGYRPSTQETDEILSI